ncbi:MAG TPA: metal ABC transporter permease [Patescibacteria group bacterium]|nr:metal ABC transporter permease [Patescibacteria group bacterium]
MLDIFQYSFILRGFEAGIIIALIAPIIGIFLVLRRYSLIADTLSHVSLAGIAIGLLLQVNPLITAIAASVASSVAIERLRLSKKVYGESALAIFLSGSLALAIVLISLAKGFSVDIFNYLFGSIATVTQTDVYIIALLGIFIFITVILFYKELIFVTFDEEAARVSGIPTRFINILLIVLAAFTVSLSIPIVGVLLIAALIVIPVVTALQFKKSFMQTIFIAEIISLFSVILGIFASYYLDLSSGGTIVLITLAIFLGKLLYRSK